MCSERTLLLTIIYQARDSKLTIEDMAGGTFTISNVSHWVEERLRHSLMRVKGGVFGSLMGTPIINLPQTGAVHRPLLPSD